MPQKEPEREILAVQIESDLKDRFEKKLQSEERNLSQGVRFLIKQYLGEIETEQQKGE